MRGGEGKKAGIPLPGGVHRSHFEVNVPRSIEVAKECGDMGKQ